MKKIIRIIAIFIIVSLIILTGKTYAVELDTLEVKLDKTTVRPGETVKVTIEFGKDLGAYTFDVTYDNNIFEYVSVDGGTPNDTSDKVRVIYHDSTGGTNPRSNMSIVFKTKEGITTSNPTEFTVTAEGLSNSDASETYDDILVPIAKNVTVEPEYIDYTLNLEYSGDIVKEEEKEMKISYSSPMGHYYEHARLVAEATTPSGANVKLLGTDEASLEHDIIQSGWGDPQGYKIGGKDVLQVLNVRGLFSDEGNYTVTLKLIDRDNSDTVIAEKTFSFNVLEKQLEVTPITPPSGESTVETPDISTESSENVSESVSENKNNTEEQINQNTNQNTNNTEEMPKELPKTGVNIYVPVVFIIAILTIIYIYNKNK